MHYFNAHTHRLPTKGEMSIYNLRIDEAAAAPQIGYFSVGIHPYDVEMVTENWIDRLYELSRHKRCVAIGEAGIDHTKGGIERQKEIFALHSSLAEELQKPLLIHCVRSQGEILTISRGVSVPRIFHSYARQNDEIQSAKNIIYSLSSRNIEQGRTIDLNQILLETDDDQLSIEQTYLQFAQSRNMSERDVAEIVERNFLSIFAL